MLMNSEDQNEKQKKAGNPLFILIIFIVLMGFVFFVPEIYKKYNSELYEFLGLGSKKEENLSIEEKPNISPVSAYYQIGGKPTFKFNEISISNVSLNENKVLSLSISVDDSFDLDKSNYYVEFFKNRETFIGRRVLLGTVNRNLSLDLDVSNLDVDTTTYFVISHIDDSTINDNMDLPSDEAGLTTFVCQKDDTSYDYEFYLRKLVKVTKKITYTNPNVEEYAEKLLEYQKLVKNYNEFRGVTSSIVENSNQFIFITEFDYGEVSNFSRIDDPHIFEKGKRDYVMDFKMDAEGYECK